MKATIVIYHDSREVKIVLPPQIAQDPIFRLGLTIGRGYDTEWDHEDKGIFWIDHHDYLDYMSLQTVPQIKRILQKEKGIKVEVKEVRS